MDGQALFVPAASGQQGEQEAQCPLGRLCPFPPGWCCLGLPRSCLKISGSCELSEGTGGRNRRVHMLKPWLECLERQLVHRLRATDPERGPPQSAFLPDLGAECAAFGNSRPVCLQSGLWKQPGRSSVGRVQVLLRGHTGQRQNPEQPLPLANLAQIFLASTGTAP